MAEIIRASSDQLQRLAASYNQAAERLRADINYIQMIGYEMEGAWESPEVSSIRGQITEKLSLAMQLYELLEQSSALLEDTARKSDAAEQELFSAFFK